MRTKQLIQHVQQFVLKTLILVVVLLVSISALRALTVILVIRNAVANPDANLMIAQRWCVPYPILRQALNEVLPDDPTRRYHIAQGPVEKIVMFAPDQLVGFVLEQTSVLWYPDVRRGAPGQSVATAGQQGPHTTIAPAPHTPQPWTDPSRVTSHEDTPPQARPGSGTRSLPQTPRTAPETRITARAEEVTPSPNEDFNPDAMWGAIISPATPVFAANGERRESVPPGSVMHITDQRQTTTGKLFTGSVHSPIGRFDNVGVREQDLHIYRGKTLPQTTREERELASDRARLTGAIAARKEEMQKAHSKENPHQAPYHQILRRYQALRKEAEELQARYEQSTGTQRISAGSRLRELKLEKTNLTPEIRKLQQQRDAWNAANPPIAAPNPEQDPQIISLRQELSQLGR